MMKILSIILILIASLGVVTEFKSEKAVIDSIPSYAVIVLFYVWGVSGPKIQRGRIQRRIKIDFGCVSFWVRDRRLSELSIYRRK